MTVPITLTNLQNLTNETTAVTTINNNSTAITTAFGSALDTAGDTMHGNLDMNSNRILNLPEPINNDEPLRLQDLVSFQQGGTINITNPGPAVDLPLADGTASVGTSTLYAREDHVHPQLVLPAAAIPLGLGTAAIGTSTLYARQDHIHPSAAVTQNHGDNSTNIATTAFVQAERLNPSGPLEFQNAVNTITQIAHPGVGSSNQNSQENIAFYDNDGGLFLGPGARTDMTMYWSVPSNFFIAHTHTRFKQPATSSTRPSPDTSWQAIGGGTATVTNNTSYGGLCVLSTNTSNIGDGGTLIQDYNAMTLSGVKMHILLELLSTSDQVVEYGLMYDVNNRVYMSRSDLASEGNWVAHCVNAGNTTSVSLPTTLNTGTTRACLAIDNIDGVNVNFWSSNFNTTIILGATINTNVPPQTLQYNPYVKLTSQAALVNRQAYITDWYTISNA